MLRFIEDMDIGRTDRYCRFKLAEHIREDWVRGIGQKYREGAAVLPFSINWREVAMGGAIFIFVMIGFGVLASAIHWPNDRDGWPLAVTAAGAIAFLPFIARALSFLQQSRASLEGPFGIKLNFSSAAATATIGTAKVTENLVQPGMQITETSFKELNEAALRTTEETVVVIDLEDGRAWYKTRLFAVAATAEILNRPKSFVLVGQRGGLPTQAGGWIRPQDIVKAIARSDPRYADVWQRAKTYLYRLQTEAEEIPAVGQPLQFPKYLHYRRAFREVGAASILFILVDQMRNPDPLWTPPTATQQSTQPTPLENHNIEPWITLGEAEAAFDPWLVRDILDLGKPENEQVAAIMAAKGEIVVATRDGRYAGLIDVARAERELLRQLLVRPAPA